MEEMSVEIVRLYFEKYKSNPYVLSKLFNYCQQLPSVIENTHRVYEERKNYTEEMITNQHLFIQKFLSTSNFFYCISSEIFFIYDGQHYTIYNEDDILYNIMSAISITQSSLMSWKRRTKIAIMKCIKEKNILTAVPESSTIQHVIGLWYPRIFSTKNDAKYFLTILGDNIRKINTHITHFLPVSMKPCMDYLREVGINYFGVSAVSTISTLRYKYRDHDYKNCRLVCGIDNINNIDTAFILENVPDIFCVSTYYSQRYNSSDNYIENHCNDVRMKDYTFYLTSRTTNDIVVSFVDEYIQIPQIQDIDTDAFDVSYEKIGGIDISWKNMQYLWRKYLEFHKLPVIMFQHILKTNLIELEILNKRYDSEKDIFRGVFSKHLPSIQLFLTFWEENITLDETETEKDFEIEELSFLFKQWATTQSTSLSILPNDKELLNIIMYYYANTIVEVEEDKYIHNIKCRLWNKSMQIGEAMSMMKDTNNIENITTISVYDAYVYYCKFCQERGYILVANKDYFSNKLYTYDI
jgi:hypothetical protein